MAKKLGKVDTFNKQLLAAIAGDLKKENIPTRTIKGYKPTESEIQQSCIKWFAMQYRTLYDDGVLFHIANEGIRLNGMGARFKREGVVRGVADLCLAIPKGGFAALYIEMKRPGNYQTPEQKTWQRNVEKYGNKYVVCKSLDEFMTIVNDYLGEKQKSDSLVD